MKIKTLFFMLVVTVLAASPVACSQGDTPETTGTGETTGNTDILTPPSAEELAENNFVSPEISRIICEKLKQMMDRGDNFKLVDAQTSANFKRGHIPGAINIPQDDSSSPYTQEWVNEQLNSLPKNEPVIFYCD
ncbi:MAG: rhodanese-like domain-containing protein [Dehalococcoidales bacterium]|nr:rhodanese-like domain-containing protein [Dehalococcoidales bacterium]